MEDCRGEMVGNVKEMKWERDNIYGGMGDSRKPIKGIMIMWLRNNVGEKLLEMPLKCGGCRRGWDMDGEMWKEMENIMVWLVT